MSVEKLLKSVKESLYQLLILYIVATRGPIHGYMVRRVLGELLGVEPSESTVYDALKRLEKMGLVESMWVRSRYGPPRKCYRAKPGVVDVLSKVVKEVKRLIEVMEEGLKHVEDSGVDAGRG